MTHRLTVRARVWNADQAREIELSGQIAKALLAPVAAYSFDLRRRYGLVIRTDREEHPGGWHGRHVLKTRVDILEIESGEELAA